MNPYNTWPRALVVLGSMAMLLGALDLMEGSLLILPGSGLVALGTYAGHRDHRWIVYRVWVFILIAIGVGAMWFLPAIRHALGNSRWWELLLIPYLAGWTMGIWGPGSPRWLLALGILVGAFHLWLVWVISHGRNKAGVIGIVLGVLGLVTIGGCITRWVLITTANRANAKPV